MNRFGWVLLALLSTGCKQVEVRYGWFNLLHVFIGASIVVPAMLFAWAPVRRWLTMQTPSFGQTVANAMGLSGPVTRGMSGKLLLGELAGLPVLLHRRAWVQVVLPSIAVTDDRSARLMGELTSYAGGRLDCDLLSLPINVDDLERLSEVTPAIVEPAERAPAY